MTRSTAAGSRPGCRGAVPGRMWPGSDARGGSSGAVQPDTYTVAKDGPRLLSAHVGEQAHKIVRGPDGSDHTVELSRDEGAMRVLSDAEAVQLAELGLRIEQHYGVPQDIE